METAVQIILQPEQYHCLEMLASEEQRSVSQMAQDLLAEQLAQRYLPSHADEFAGTDIASLAAAGGAFEWLADEPELYDDTCGEPV